MDEVGSGQVEKVDGNLLDELDDNQVKYNRANNDKVDGDHVDEVDKVDNWQVDEMYKGHSG